MYPGTIVNWYDESEIQTSSGISVSDTKPLFMVVSSFDKGPEELMEVEGTDFNNLFGNMYFSKHGQNAIQAQRIIDAGGKLLVKRVCAKDATLANLVLTANVSSTQTQKTDSEGNNIYLNEAGEETTEVTETPVMETAVNVKWTASSITGCESLADVREAALKLLDEENGVYPLMIASDNGRGTSSKAIRLVPDYNTSKGIGKMFYSLAVYEGTATIENEPITFDPTVIYSNKAYGLNEETMTQIKGEVVESAYEAYVNKLASLLGVAADDIRNNDLVYGYTYKGATLEGLTIDAESVDINSQYGVELKEGSNGEFGDTPAGSSAWTEAMRSVWAGEVTDRIWDVDTYKICAVCDANLPLVVKEAIAEFVTFRKDCVFFRDLGIGNNTFISIKSAFNQNRTFNNFISDYSTSYQIKDPITKRNIEVTMMYDFAACLVAHFDAGAYNPLAGTVNSFVLENAIKGTVNYTPIITPSVNQKQAMEDLRVNYAIFEDDNCVVQTCYTSQEEYTQLSYVNNVLGIQEVVRAVRTACPKNRYSLTSGSDLSDYAKAVNTVLTNFASNFNTLVFEYTQDSLKASQKIFYASIKFAFRNWAQTEMIDVYAINNN